MYNKSNLSKLEKMDGLAPEVMKAFWAFDKAALAAAAIPAKYKELIAVGVALTTQCPYCIDIHAGNARNAGATEAEIAEAAMVAAALRAGAAVTHAVHALADCATASERCLRGKDAAGTSADEGAALGKKCAMLGSNQRLLACEASALPLS
jgi:AhpD family alkylhydroperoxidase